MTATDTSRGHNSGFDSMCDELAQCLGASRATVQAAGHEIQITGAPIDDAFKALVAPRREVTTADVIQIATTTQIRKSHVHHAP